MKYKLATAVLAVMAMVVPTTTAATVTTTRPTDGTAPCLTPDFLLRSQGFDPGNTTPASSSDKAATPAAVGNLAAKAVLDFRHNDGSNQLNGYADTCNPKCYQPVNSWNQ